MRLASGEVLDDAMQLILNHSWRCNRPVISEDQLAELIPVLAPLFQQSRPKVRQDRPKQKAAARPNTKVDKGSQTEGRRLVYRRSGGMCEIRLAEICEVRAAEWHHRLNKGQGGRWDASNGLHLCRACHAYVTDQEREEAKQKGWAVPPGITPPIEVPVLRRGVLVYLDDDGSFEVVEGKVA